MIVGKDHITGLFMEMGLGKSKVAIDTVGKLKSKGEVDSVMIVAPKGVYDNWVKQEIPNHLPDEFERFVVRWQPSNSKAFQESMQRLVFEIMAGIKFFVINVEAFSSDRGKKAAYYFLKKNPDNMMIVDESTTIKNRKASRTKNIMQLSKYAKYKRILTGSPVTKSPYGFVLSVCLLRYHVIGSGQLLCLSKQVCRSTKKIYGCTELQ